MTISLTSDAYVLAAAEALEKSGEQTHSTEAMDAHTRRASVLLSMAVLLAEREAANLLAPEPPLPVAFLDCHDRLWEQMGNGGGYSTSVDGETMYRHINNVRESFGPLREVK